MRTLQNSPTEQQPYVDTAAVVDRQCVVQSLVDLSREQLDDVLYVRQLYLTKRGLLAEARNALVAQIHAVSGSILTAGDSATKLCSLTCKLQQNAMQDYLIYIKVCAAVRRGVSLLICVLTYLLCAESGQKVSADLCPTALAGTRVAQQYIVE